MRIRKNTKFSLSHLYTTSSSTIVCHLNQNPWDVVDFSPPPPPPPPLPPFPPPSQVNGNGFYIENRSSFDDNLRLIGETNENQKMEEMDTKQRKKGKVVLCSKSDGKKWKCRREAIAGSSLCHHHVHLQSNKSSSSNESKKKKKKKPVAVESQRDKNSEKPSDESSSSSSDKNEFYYYSGFGPRWGKKRAQVSGKQHASEQQRDLTSLLLSESDDSEYDVDDNGNGKRKRDRKPVKARSLKSLM